MSPRRRSDAGRSGLSGPSGLSGLSGTTAAPIAAAEREHIRRGFLGLALAHELKQPLHSLNLNIELLSKRMAKIQAGEAPPDVGGPLGALGRVCDRINDCLDAFSARVTPDPVSSEPQSITPLLEAAVERARRGKVNVVLRLADDLPEISVNPEQIAVALDALIDNASRAGKPGAEIILSAAYADDDVRVEISDRGSGMTPEVARRAVEIGFSTWGGSGVGLTVAKFVAYHHAGGFQVSSTPGQGTTVAMSLPATDVRD
jgi:signal transduction histidine kinase